jgi:hypothetical protein
MRPLQPETCRRDVAPLRLSCADPKAREHDAISAAFQPIVSDLLLSLCACAEEHPNPPLPENEVARDEINSELDASDLIAVPARDPDAPEMRAYRSRTIGLLRRYFRMSIEIGRLPSILGREIFRARVTSYRMSTFEDIVIFTHDMERCLDRLDALSRLLIARMVFQEYTFEEAASILGCGLSTLKRNFPLAIDAFSDVLLRYGLLKPFPSHERHFFLSRPKNGAISSK